MEPILQLLDAEWPRIATSPQARRALIRWANDHEALAGMRDLTCSAWAIPTRNIRGWKGPCYLMTDGHYRSYRELLERTDCGSNRRAARTDYEHHGIDVLREQLPAQPLAFIIEGLRLGIELVQSFGVCGPFDGGRSGQGKSPRTS